MAAVFGRADGRWNAEVPSEEVARGSRGVFMKIKRIIAQALRMTGRVPSAPSFASYAEALATCAPGYEDHEVAGCVLAKTRASIRQDLGPMIGTHSTMATLLAIGAVRGSQPKRVLDFGGAFGTAYHLLYQKMPAISVHWAVVENATFAQHGKAFATETLQFFSRISDAVQWLGGVDLVYSSGGLQYTPEPERFLQDLIATRPRVIALLRCALSRGESVITVQFSRLSENGPGPLPEGFMDRGVSYPLTFMRDADLRAACRDYRILVHSELIAERQTIGGQPLITGEAFVWHAR
jgi:putative methyltransferase (TIGR04325 family)